MIVVPSPATLRKAIEFSGVNARELARRLGVVEETVSRWCNGRRIKKLHWLAVLSALDLPRDWKP